MAGPTIFDHLFVIVMMIVIPLHSWHAFPGVIEDIRRRGEPARIAAYRQVILTFAAAAAVVIALWVWLQRDWPAIGFRTGEPGSQALAIVIAAVFVVILVVPIRKLALAAESGDENAADLSKQVGNVAFFLPSTRREEHWFYGVSVNAGVTEELIFRGYLIWYLLHYVDTLWAACIAVLAFGLAHIYQGLRQLPGILFVSAVTVTTYLVSQSLIVPIVLHIVVDAVQGYYIARIQRAQTTSS
ncbi:MAG: CPBP family intramembrane glutamic endopeptidase [Woeseiaceae bacterium]|nr:CPBP family intramembrane glutamic endopeptidase [Woeseiaceae bacterium]